MERYHLLLNCGSGRQQLTWRNFIVMGCRVAVECPHRQPQRGNSYHVRIDLTVPGGELVIKHEPSLKTRARQSGEAEIKKRLEVRSLPPSESLGANDTSSNRGHHQP